ncbi:hypothetical protein ACFO4O_04400 [Glaciecola siphonariae]|uniref:Uncharacterized protein n=1 Tax=Glaciecola siphonariae TaxID=521012 RepID=A0ABV9LT70_9ALTE
MLSWFKAKLLLLSVALIWALFIVFMSPLQLPVTLLAIRYKKMRRYRYGLWIAQDQLVNAIHAGNPDVTISSKVGYMARKGSKTAYAMAKVIDGLFYLAIGQKNHCDISIETDEEHYEFK